MNTIKNWLIGGAILIVIAAFVTVNIQSRKIKALKAENERVTNNNDQLMAANSNNVALILKKDEFIGQLSDSTRNLLKSLKIAPKKVVEIIEKTVTIRDTIIKEVPVTTVGPNFWKISDKDKCFDWRADARLIKDSLKINRTFFTYHNKTTDVFSKKLVFKFLFIKIYSGKKIIQNSVSECGESKQRTITVIK